MNIGDLDISGLYVGSEEAVAVYLGDEQVFPNGITGWSVSPASINVASSGGTKNITIKSLSSWTISSNDNWITLSPESGDSGTSTVVATIASASTSRTGYIIATDGTSSTTITVAQAYCNPIVCADHLGNINNQGKTYGNKFYLFDTGVTDINDCNYSFSGITSICCRYDAFYQGNKVASFGTTGDGATSSLQTVDIDCTGVLCINFPFGADNITYTAITSVTMYNTDSVTWFGNFIYWSPNVVSVKLGNLSNATLHNPDGRIFGPNNTGLTNLEIDGLPDENITANNWGFSYCTGLTVNSLVSILNALPQTNQNRNITLGTTNKNKLSAAQLAIATNKGWTVS